MKTKLVVKILREQLLLERLKLAVKKQLGRP